MDSFGLNKETSGTLSDVDFAVIVVWHESFSTKSFSTESFSTESFSTCTGSDNDEMTIGTVWNRRVIGKINLTRIPVDQPLSPYRRARKCDPPRTSRSWSGVSLWLGATSFVEPVAAV
jgi:hypothetical protein